MTLNTRHTVHRRPTRLCGKKTAKTNRLTVVDVFDRLRDLAAQWSTIDLLAVRLVKCTRTWTRQTVPCGSKSTVSPDGISHISPVSLLLASSRVPRLFFSARNNTTSIAACAFSFRERTAATRVIYYNYNYSGERHTSVQLWRFENRIYHSTGCERPARSDGVPRTAGPTGFKRYWYIRVCIRVHVYIEDERILFRFLNKKNK